MFQNNHWLEIIWRESKALNARAVAQHDDISACPFMQSQCVNLLLLSILKGAPRFRVDDLTIWRAVLDYKSKGLHSTEK